MAGQGTVSNINFLSPLGIATIANASIVAAAGLGTIPDNTLVAFIQAEGGDVKWTDDGTTPTSTVGKRLYDGQELQYSGPLKSLKIISVSGTPQLNVSYYKQY